MRTVWKFAIDSLSTQVIEMPVGAQVLHVGSADGVYPHLWALVDPEAPREPRTFLLRGTGHPVDDELAYIGSFAINGGVFVGHLFEPNPDPTEEL